MFVDPPSPCKSMLIELAATLLLKYPTWFPVASPVKDFIYLKPSVWFDAAAFAPP